MNSPLVDLERRMRVALPNAIILRQQFAAADRIAAFEVRQGERLITVMWTPADGLCITEVRDDSGFDDTPDYSSVSEPEALELVQFLLGSGSELRGMSAALP